MFDFVHRQFSATLAQNQYLKQVRLFSIYPQGALCIYIGNACMAWVVLTFVKCKLQMVWCIVWQGEEEHSLRGAKQLRTMQASKREKPDPVPGPRRIITRSRATLLPLSYGKFCIINKFTL